MTRYGEYLVNGRRNYRGHQPGTTFVASLDRGAEQRAVRRGDLKLLRHFTPALEPGSYRLPDGWLTSVPPQANQRPERASLIEGS